MLQTCTPTAQGKLIKIYPKETKLYQIPIVCVCTAKKFASINECYVSEHSELKNSNIVPILFVYFVRAKYDIRLKNTTQFYYTINGIVTQIIIRF